MKTLKYKHVLRKSKKLGSWINEVSNSLRALLVTKINETIYNSIERKKEKGKVAENLNRKMLTGEQINKPFKAF